MQNILQSRLKLIGGSASNSLEGKWESTKRIYHSGIVLEQERILRQILEQIWTFKRRRDIKHNDTELQCDQIGQNFAI